MQNRSKGRNSSNQKGQLRSCTGEHMRHLALTGISKESIDDLVTKRVRTFELRSAHNIPIVFEAHVGDELFVTDTSRHDLAIGTTGVLARVRDKTISMHKVSHRIGDFYEERELMSARVQLELREHDVSAASY